MMGGGMTENQFMDHYSAMKPYISSNVFVLFGPIFENWHMEDFMKRKGFTKSMRCEIQLEDWKNGTKIMWNPDKVDVELKKGREMDTMQLAVCKANYRDFIKKAFKQFMEDPMGTYIRDRID
ncbi:hypothetical protein ACH5RR_039026 [Cinchona calisaya]|uniref:Uncharacterized protein n=1 Tax=Cinchona calisaya TaxID=153742 RepID=A0ABD2XXK3_9GENT